jgi:8-oxo-dGTP pyrophosphatase MutT (NUDIX family)
MITCQSIYGNTVSVPREKLAFRVSAYAVVISNGKILLLTSRSARKLCFPGGGMDPMQEVFERLQGSRDHIEKGE